MNNTITPRPEHPRPDFVRDTFCNLNGTWDFMFDDQDVGLLNGWYRPGHKFDNHIIVPFCYQSSASGIGPTDEIHPVMWYRRSFHIPTEMQGRHVLLRFGAVDHEATVYVNGQSVGCHVGGYTPFSLDITPFLAEGKNDLCVRVVDRPDPIQLRGKQNWNRGLMGCWYTPCSGIWQTVYLEAVSDVHVEYIHITPDIDRGLAYAEVVFNRKPDEDTYITLCAKLGERKICEISSSVINRNAMITLDMKTNDSPHPVALWSMQHPNLYDIQVTVTRNGFVVDNVATYFGMRKIEVKDGIVYLNNQRLYQRLILDQGYWSDTLLTPPSDEAIQDDLRWTLRFGYNGARKHQKIEDPRYYYWADKMGVLVWGELPSPYCYTDETVVNLSDTMLEFIRRDFNHPSIITWVPLNESWGVPFIYNNKRQQMTASMLYYMTKAADGTRLCSCNDGWEQTHTDICGMHDYSADGNTLQKHFSERKSVETYGCDVRFAYAKDHTPTGTEAFLVTEYGGIAFENIGPQGMMGGMQTWGYHEKVTDEDSFFERFQASTDAIKAIPYNQGFCYTQLTDVMQEINGLLTPERLPKMDVDRFKKINKSPIGR